MNCVYRYVDKVTNEILYVGKTDSSLENRILQHKSEDKFKKIDARIEYIELKNAMETRFYEFYYINKWKPALNVSDKYEDDLGVELPDAEWKLYVPEKKEATTKHYPTKAEREARYRKMIDEMAEKLRSENKLIEDDKIPLGQFTDDEKTILKFLCKHYAGNSKICFYEDEFRKETKSECDIYDVLSEISEKDMSICTYSHLSFCGYICHIEHCVSEHCYEVTLTDVVIDYIDSVFDE